MNPLTKHSGHLVEGLAWTKEKPTAPGWYWWRTTHRGDEVVNIFIGGGKNGKRFYVSYLGLDESPPLLDHVSGQWSGPIPQPTDPPAQEFVSVPLAEADLARIRETSLRAAERLKP